MSDEDNVLQFVEVSSVENAYASPVYEPWERGSVSTYKGGCGRRVNLGTAERMAQLESGEPEDGLVGSDAAKVGTLWHRELSGYHAVEGERPYLPAWGLPPMHDEHVADARALTSSYIKSGVKPDSVGRVLYNEKMFPQTVEQKVIIEELLGVPYKMVLDLVVDVDEATMKWWNNRGADLAEPGVYVVDHKSLTRNRPDETFIDDHQTIAYQVCLNALHLAGEITLPGEVKGMIYNIAVRNKEPKFRACSAPFPDEDQFAMVRADFTRAYEDIKADRANGFACYDAWNRPCRFLTNGMCRRV